MLDSGLVSITFRNKTPLEICKLCRKANLSAVEWGGDVHVPPRGNKAKETLHLTGEHGLIVSSYGSYFRLGQGADAFMYNLEEAVNLNAPVMRIWAGAKGSREYQMDERKLLADELMLLSEKAFDANVRVALEYHPNTLTDDRESVRKLLKETEGETFSPVFYWQPRWDWEAGETLSAISDLGDRLSHAHVFAWEHRADGIIRKPIAEGEKLLTSALAIKKDGYALIEFVKDDSDEMLIKDAETLNKWINGRK
ncbi:MAG: sugar phosphate isomerase/epimerase [Clostridia bacterium]|nr:sugar phosphate isomerase/epimerase [Clostridia bacterium]